jgi:hypothetical protein
MNHKIEKVNDILEEYTNKYNYVVLPTKNDAKGKPKQAITKGWQNLVKTPYYEFTKKYDGIAVVTGYISDITVIDFDFKKDNDNNNINDGIELYNFLINKYGNIKTPCCQTASGGIHLYFKYNSALLTGTKINNYTIDIRNNRAYVVAPPSKNYKWLVHPSECPPCEVPFWLLEHIIVNNNAKNKKNISFGTFENNLQVNNDKSFYPLSNENKRLISYALNALEPEMVDNYNNWFLVTSALKSTCYNNDKDDCQYIIKKWEIWSKKSKSYDKLNNKKIWDGLEPKLGINYLFGMANMLKVSLNKTLKFEPLKNMNDITTCNDSENKYINIIDYINNYNTILVKAPTGSGKSTQARCIINKIYNSDSRIRLLSIVSRKTLKDAHICLFNNPTNIEHKKNWLHKLSEKKTGKSVNNTDIYDIQDYEICKDINKATKLSIQLDSLSKIENITSWSGCILFLDEVNSMINYLITSDTMINKRVGIYKNLIYLIKNCKYLIGVDADMTDITLNFISDMRNKETTIFYNNTFQNYKNIKAYEYKNINTIVYNLYKDIIDGKHPIIACDSKSYINFIYEEIKKNIEKNNTDLLDYYINNTLLYTRDEGCGEDIQDVNTSWENKIIFYSPRIIYGIDFHPPQHEPVYIISISGSLHPIKNKNVEHTLNSCELAQQMNRNRLISKLHFHIASKNQKLNYISKDDVTNDLNNHLNGYSSMINNYKINDSTIDDDGNMIINNSKINNLWTNITFNNSILNSNKQYHFTQIIKKKGFDIIYISDKLSFYDNEKEENKQQYKLYEDTISNNKSKAMDVYRKIIDNNEHEIEPKYQRKIEEIKNRMEILGFINGDKTYKNNISKYAELIVTQEFNNFLNFRLLASSHDKIKSIINTNKYKDFNVYISKSQLSKISIIKQFEEILGLQSFETPEDSFNDDETIYNIDDNLFNYTKVLFRIEKEEKPTLKRDIYKYIYRFYNNVVPKIIYNISVGKKMKNKIKYIQYMYKFSTINIRTFLELLKYSNPNFENIEPFFIQKYLNIDICEISDL